MYKGVSQKRPPELNCNVWSNNPLLCKKRLENENVTRLFLNITKIISNFITTSKWFAL